MFGHTFNTSETRAVMPAVHQARRTLANRKAGNPFATEARIRKSIEELSRLYQMVSSVALLEKIKVELDALETVACE